MPKQTSLSGLPPTPASGPLPFNSGLRCVISRFGNIQNATLLLETPLSQSSFWKGLRDMRFQNPCIDKIDHQTQRQNPTFLFSLVQMPQCHNSHPKLLQHQRCKSGQLAQTNVKIIIWWSYPRPQTSLFHRTLKKTS